jgi:hypothetical protein
MLDASGHILFLSTLQRGGFLARRPLVRAPVKAGRAANP